MKMNKKLKALFKMSQKGVKAYAATLLTETHDEVIVDDGYVYAQGTFPVLLVAHLDTVHKDRVQTFFYNSKTEAYSSPQGIGGDDRCGIYMVLEIIKKYNCSVLFCEDEEIGMVGAQKFIETDLAKDLEFNYIIEFDRKGNNDAVFYDCDNPEFEEFICKDFYESSWGTFSDISTLAPFLGCAAVNLSCGYYNAHTTQEYVVIPEMEKSIAEACKILDRTTADDKFEYIEAQYSGRYFGGWYDDDFDYYYNNGYRGRTDTKCQKEMYYLIEFDNRGIEDLYDTSASSEAEAIGRLCMTYPHITFNDIINIDCDDYLGL